CGDGFVQAGVEQCDDGAFNSTLPNACRPGCIKPACHDGVVDNGEQCDDANRDDTDGCVLECKKAVCGDGVLYKDHEECDDGKNTTNSLPDHCRNDCHPAHCGDKYTDSGESCDDGNGKSGDGCSPSCATETPAPGDKLPELGSVSDSGPTWDRSDVD